MKATGIVRKIDQLGRIVIPKELRNVMGLEIGTPMEIYVEEERIIVQKYEPSIKACMVTGESSHEHLLLADGNIVISKRAATQLLEELQKQMSAPQDEQEEKEVVALS
ncbi:AbrB/MazE/SpoVT family DNA-binding domain-containing protein [Bacillus sp. FSL W7-1360]